MSTVRNLRISPGPVRIDDALPKIMLRAIRRKQTTTRSHRNQRKAQANPTTATPVRVVSHSIAPTRGYRLKSTTSPVSENPRLPTPRQIPFHFRSPRLARLSKSTNRPKFPRPPMSRARPTSCSAPSKNDSRTKNLTSEQHTFRGKWLKDPRSACFSRGPHRKLLSPLSPTNDRARLETRSEVIELGGIWSRPWIPADVLPHVRANTEIILKNRIPFRTSREHCRVDPHGMIRLKSSWGSSAGLIFYCSPDYREMARASRSFSDCLNHSAMNDQSYGIETSFSLTNFAPYDNYFELSPNFRFIALRILASCV